MPKPIYDLDSMTRSPIWSDETIRKKTREAVAEYWTTRSKQSDSKKKEDTGTRGEVTGGRHLDGLLSVFAEASEAAGYTKDDLARGNELTVPGFYRPTKKWDLVIHRGDRLVAALELKSQVGPSFGNNFNNRSEEAIGNSTDFWRAFEASVYGKRPPWLGYVMLLEHAEGSTTPVSIPRTRLRVLPEYTGTSYADRYALLIGKLLKDRKYSSAAFITSPRGNDGEYEEPDRDLTMTLCVRSFFAHLVANRD